MKTQGISGAEHGLCASGDHFLNFKIPWTKNEVERLKNLIDQNMSPTMIANKLERPISAIRMKAIELGLRLPDPKY